MEELPDLVARHEERTTALENLEALVEQLKATREEKGLSLADMTRLTGMDRSALSKLETGQRPNPTIETLIRYAEAVGKRLVVSLGGCLRIHVWKKKGSGEEKGSGSVPRHLSIPAEPDPFPVQSSARDSLALPRLGEPPG